VLLREEHCRVTGVAEPRHLKASHIKPWRDATDAELEAYFREMARWMGGGGG